MSDKEVIIDGVNISKCKDYDDGYCAQSYIGEGGLLKNTKNPKACKFSLNCYYKQLAHKTEELQSSKEQQFLVEQESISKSTYICELEEKLHAERQKVKELEEFKAKLSKLIIFPAPAPEIIALTEKYKQALEEIKPLAHNLRTRTDYESEDDVNQDIEAILKQCEVLNNV